MSKKSAKIAALIDSCRGQELDAHYLGYFECFNQALFYEAHDVLEELWLPDRQGPNGSFYKGLIQFTGAFVLLQKNRLRPAARLFKLAQENLQKYPPLHEHLDLAQVLGLIQAWLGMLESGKFTINPLTKAKAPKLQLTTSIPSVTTLLIATRNDHKVGEIRAILSDRFAYLTLRDFPDAPGVIEDAATFAGNATKKSVELAEWLATHPTIDRTTHPALFVLADDSGLEVDALGGAPGVHSARFAALDANRADNSTDADNNAKLLRLLRDIPAGRRGARFRCVLALTEVAAPGLENASAVRSANKTKVQVKLFDGVCEGQIGFAPSGGGGFGYDPLFIPDGHQQTFAELGDSAKNQLSHRAKALAKLREHLDSMAARQVQYKT